MISQHSATRTAACAVAIAAGLFVLYFAWMGSYPLIDPDEPVYGQVAKEMAGGVGWLTPHYAGKPWFDKPPLFYWLSGICARFLGPTELACRLPSAVLAVGLVLVVYALACYDFGRRAGILSALAIATCLQQIVLARAAVTEMTLVFCLSMALYAYRRWLDAQGRARFGWIALCGVATGLGMLAKGPVAPVLLGVTFVIHLAWTRRLRRLASADALAGIVAALVVGLPWYIAMYLLHREAFVQGFLVANNLARFLKPEHAGQTGGWYSYLLNIPILLVFFFPWSMFLPGAIRLSWRANDGARLALAWFAVVFVFFSLSKTILVTYIFPLYPAAALFVGVIWDSASSNEGGTARSIRRGLWAALAISVVIGVGAAASGLAKYPEAARAALVLGAILVAMAAAALIVTSSGKRGDPAVGAWVIGGGMVLFALWLMIGVMPVLAPRASTRDLIRRVPSISGAKLVEYSVEKPSILFYAGRRPERTYDPAKVKRLLAEEASVVVFCKKSDAAAITAPGTVPAAESGGLVAFVSATGPAKGSEAK